MSGLVTNATTYLWIAFSENFRLSDLELFCLSRAGAIRQRTA